MNRRKLLMATTNPGKQREILAVLDRLPLNVCTLADFPGLPQAVENADTFAGNAEIKARHFAALTGLWTLADDSGLEVNALDGAPGVYSARFAGSHADDKANNSRLCAALADVPEQDRTARFRCVLVLADRSEVLAVTSGVWEGRIVIKPAGDNGFGYDPHFFLPELGCTAAQLAPEQKNRISHRGLALDTMRRRIEELVASRQL